MKQRLSALKAKANAAAELRATADKSGFCTRCHEHVRTVRPWPHWRKVRYGYFAVLGVALYGAPVLLADGFILIPTLMVFIAAIGPLNSLVRKKPTCIQCGAVVDWRVLAGEAQPAVPEHKAPESIAAPKA